MDPHPAEYKAAGHGFHCAFVKVEQTYRTVVRFNSEDVPNLGST